MKVRNPLQRVKYGISAFVLFLAALTTSLSGQVAHAFPSGGQVTSRSIKMSTSTASASATYDVKFTMASSFTLKGIIVDICRGNDTPIVGDSNCTAPTGFSWGTPNGNTTLVSGISGGNWATTGATTLNSGRTLKLVDATGNAVTNATTVEFTIAAVTNPSDTDTVTAGAQHGTFYARIITYSSNTGDIASYAPGTEGSTANDPMDYGGIALSLADQLTITAKVQEQLTFCVAASITGSVCSGASGSSVALGNANGVLASYSTNYTNTAQFDVQSNASSGVIIRMYGKNLCRLASPCTDSDTANIINPSTTSGNMTCTADSATTSVEQFGMRLSALGSGVTATAPYNCAASSHGFDTNSTNGTLSTYGTQIASTAGPGDEVTSTMEFMAKAATTSEAGIYTTNLTFIATGTY